MKPGDASARVEDIKTAAARGEAQEPNLRRIANAGLGAGFLPFPASNTGDLHWRQRAFVRFAECY